MDESPSLKSKKTKREKLIISANYYKNALRKWEAAIFKAEGRNPSKEDLKNSPESIQKAYKEYYKLKKYLESSKGKEGSNSKLSVKNKKSRPSPNKIFGGKRAGNRENQNQCSNVPIKDTKNANDHHLIETHESKSSSQDASVKFNFFQQKIFSVVNIFSTNSSDKPHNTIKVIDDQSGEEVTRKALIPNRFAKKSFANVEAVETASSTSFCDTGNADAVSAEPTTNNTALLLMDEADDIPMACISTEKDQLSLNLNQKLSSVSVIWQNLTPEKVQESSKGSKQVDSGWLDRCGMDCHEPAAVALNSVLWQNLTPEKVQESSQGAKQVDSGWLDRCRMDCHEPAVALNSVLEKEIPEIEEESRKRKAIAAFSPSPKKPSPKKKFFKSSRPKESLPKYKLQSYKPPTPIKRNKVQQHPPATVDSKLINHVTEDSSNNASSSNSRVQIQEPQNNDYFDELAQNSVPRKGNKRPRFTKKEQLQSKIDRGKVNENYLKIDITKKVFVRGRKRISGAKTKRNDWKLKRVSSNKEDKLSKMICRKCGEAGHFRKFCMKDVLPKDGPEAENIDDSPFPSLEEASRMVRSKLGGSNLTRTNVFDNSATKQDKDCVDEVISPSNCDTDNEQSNESNIITSQPVNLYVKKPILPYFCPENFSKLYSQEEEEAILLETVKIFGYEKFRFGQMEIITRILKGLSTLVILSTGSGKSLCYQLPAYLYAQKYPGSLAICVSPLVSLMEDQVQGIPSFLQAAFLHSNMLASQREKVLEKIRSKKLHILLVSPEAVCGGLFGILRGGTADLPQISFACIDEVHCVSQWSHNFRPCYLQISKILREKLHVSTILGLTATATEYTAASICENLYIDPSTTVRGSIIPDNLNLSVSRDTYRDEALIALLRGERFKECESIIIYCTRREECQRISCLIRTTLQDIPGSNGITKINLKQRVSNNCEAYHAGMTAGRRRLVQQQFMSGNIRIVVATVAFGMGIDKSNIRSVIHYNMPKTFESYVQEIGRAGRDGLPAHCHLFLDNVKGRDLNELRRHVYANTVDRPTLRKLIRKVFQPCKCARIAELSHNTGESITKKTKSRCPGHEVSFRINETVEELDLAQENIITLLCYLELDKRKKWVEILPHTYETCKIHSYGGPALLKSAAMKCPPLAAAIALQKEKRKFKDTDAYLEFNVIEVSATLNWNSGIVKKELKSLEWAAVEFDKKGNSSRFRKSGILVEFSDLAFHLNASGDLTDEEADVVLNYLHSHNQEQEKSQLYQLNRVYQALLSVSYTNVENVCDVFDEDKSGMLKNFIRNYFTQKTLGVPPEWKNEAKLEDGKDDVIRRDIQDLLSSVRDGKFTGRAIAKIFQGIPSPCFPAEQWSRNRAFWRKHIDADFHILCQIAGQEILRTQ